MEDFKLYNGVTIPAIGFGTWQAKNGKEAYQACRWALEAGYRHIDTAFVYGNEKSVGKAIRDSKINREDIFITTKCPASIKTYKGAKKYFKRSIKRLGVKYVDLYLIHAPWPWDEVGKDCKEGNIEVWKAFIELYNEGKARSIGVSNFSVDDIKNIVDATSFKPMVNQIRYFISNTQEEITSYCQANDILVEAYSPLGTGEIIHNEILEKLAAKYKVSVPKLCINYCLKKNTLPLPKSVHQDRIYDNFDVEFKITKKDMEYLDSLKNIGSYKKLRS